MSRSAVSVSRGLWFLGWACFSLILLDGNRSDGGPLLESFTMTVGGQSNFGTYSAPAPVYNGFFGQGNVLGVSIPSNGSFSNPSFLAPTGIDGSWRQQTATSGVLSDSMSVSTTFNAGANTYTGSAAAQTQFGQIGVEAHGTLTGTFNGNLVDGSEAYGLYRDSMQFFSSTIAANGGTGFVQYHFTIDGSLSSVGPGTADIEALYQHGTNPIYTLMRAQVDSRFGTFISGATIASVSNASAYGYTSTLGPGTASLSGTGVFDSFFEQFTVGSSVDVTFGLLAFGWPATDGTNDASFMSTARLTGIDIYDQFGRRVTDFTITSGSGTVYDANGAHPTNLNAVPEPSSLILALIGSAIGAASRVRRRSSSSSLAA